MPFFQEISNFSKHKNKNEISQIHKQSKTQLDVSCLITWRNAELKNNKWNHWDLITNVTTIWGGIGIDKTVVEWGDWKLSLKIRKLNS